MTNNLSKKFYIFATFLDYLQPPSALSYQSTFANKQLESQTISAKSTQIHIQRVVRAMASATHDIAKRTLECLDLIKKRSSPQSVKLAVSNSPCRASIEQTKFIL